MGPRRERSDRRTASMIKPLAATARMAESRLQAQKAGPNASPARIRRAIAQGPSRPWVQASNTAEGHPPAPKAF